MFIETGMIVEVEIFDDTRPYIGIVTHIVIEKFKNGMTNKNGTDFDGLLFVEEIEKENPWFGIAAISFRGIKSINVISESKEHK